MDGFSSAMKLTGLDDFISPSQACVKPLEAPKPTSKRSIISIEEDGKYVETLESGERKELAPAKLTLNDCLACSGCVTTAETMLIQAQSAAEFFANLKKPEGRTFVVSVSPQVRASLAARFNLSAVETHRRIVSLLTSWGVHHVVDTSFSRDFSLIEIAAEFVERVRRARTGAKDGEFVLPYISTSKSPQQVMGTLVKQYLAAKLGVSPASIYHTSLMPCFDKKLEAAREDFLDPVHGRDVDCVLTSVEIEQTRRSTFPRYHPRLCLSYGNAIGVPGGSGGYAETVLRQAALVLHNHTLGEIQWRQGRSPDVKEASLEIDGQRVLTVALVYGFKNIQNLIRKMKTGGTGYDFVEIMACPSGCINGGGQLRAVAPETPKDLIKRVDTIYHAQLQPTSPHHNPVVTQLYARLGGLPLIIHRYSEWVKGAPYSPEAKRVLHTQYHAREKMASNKLTIQW